MTHIKVTLIVSIWETSLVVKCYRWQQLPVCWSEITTCPRQKRAEVLYGVTHLKVTFTFSIWDKSLVSKWYRWRQLPVCSSEITACPRQKGAGVFFGMTHVTVTLTFFIRVSLVPTTRAQAKARGACIKTHRATSTIKLPTKKTPRRHFNLPCRQGPGTAFTILLP